MQVLGTVPAGTIIEKAEWDEAGQYTVHVKLPDGKLHAVLGFDMLSVWEALFDWIRDYEAGKTQD